MHDFDYKLLDSLKIAFERLGRTCSIVADEYDTTNISLKFSEFVGSDNKKEIPIEFICMDVSNIQDQQDPFTIVTVVATLLEDFSNKSLDMLNRACMHSNIVGDGASLITTYEPSVLFCKSDIVIRHDYTMGMILQICMDTYNLVLRLSDESIDYLTEIVSYTFGENEILNGVD